MLIDPIRAPRLAALALPLLLTAACHDTTGLGARRPLSVSFLVNGTAGAPSASSSTSGASFDAASTATDTLVITRVQFALSHIELGQTSATCTAAASGEEGECEELELDPMLVELTPGSSAKSTLNAAVPAGSYTSFQGVIGPVRQGDDDSGAKIFLAAHPAFASKSVRVEGTYLGKPFAYESALRGEIESEFNPPLAVTKDGMNLTVALDMSRWFRTTDGRLIDPATATPGSTNDEIVARNIRRSFHAFEDDDRDGHDDHER